MFKSNYQRFIIHLHMHTINLTEEIRVANATVKCEFWIDPFLNRRLNVDPPGSWIYSLIRTETTTNGCNLRFIPSALQPGAPVPLSSFLQ
jgi:hypothetical protein